MEVKEVREVLEVKEVRDGAQGRRPYRSRMAERRPRSSRRSSAKTLVGPCCSSALYMEGNGSSRCAFCSGNGSRCAYCSACPVYIAQRKAGSVGQLHFLAVSRQKLAGIMLKSTVLLHCPSHMSVVTPVWWSLTASQVWLLLCILQQDCF